MLPEEARWIGERLQGITTGAAPVLNIGSSIGTFITERQPWIHRHLFAPMRARGQHVLNVDLKSAPGVDLVGDICDPGFQQRVATTGGGAVICTNLLEHVERPADVARALVTLVPPGAYLVVSGPRSYPWHPDPIDTRFRPDVDALATLFPGTELVEGAVVPSGTYYDWLGRSPWRLLGAFGRLLLPFWSPRWWWADLLKLGWLFRPFTATCVLLRKR